jgi:acyl carrier protein
MGATESDLIDLIASEAIVERSALRRDASFTDLGIQSLDVISVLFEIEERYGVAIEEEEMPRASSLGEVLDYLLTRINAAHA